MSNGVRDGKTSKAEVRRRETCMRRSEGPCMTMRTTSSAWPAVVARRYAFTQPSDQRIVQQVSSLVPGHRFSSLP
jgi:hypothetical protein